MSRDSVDVLHAGGNQGEGVVKSVGFGVGPIWAQVSALTLTGCVRERWAGLGAPGEQGGPRGIYGNTHGVPKMKKGSQGATRARLELESGDFLRSVVISLLGE